MFFKKGELTNSVLFKRTLLFFVPFFCLVVFVVLFVYLVSFKTIRASQKQLQKKIVDMQKHYIAKDVCSAISDLLYLTHTHEMDTLVRFPAAFDLIAQRRIQNNFLQFVKSRTMYDQVRFISYKGQELIRVNYNNGKPAIVNIQKLQNKKHRYYFKEAVVLAEKQIYISPFDLNIEYKKVELPHKPMIRFATPKFDKYGKSRGVVILNYMGRELLEKLVHVVMGRESKSFLINREGYWLKGPDESSEWGFMLTNRAKAKIQNVFPDAANRIFAQKSGQFETRHGLFTYATVYPLMEWNFFSRGKLQGFSAKKSSAYNRYYWKTISFIPAKFLYAQSNAWRNVIIVFFVFVAILSWLIFWRLSIANLLRRNAEAKMKVAKEKAEEANAAKSRFLANMSHEIRTPMNAILGFAEILQEEIKDPKQISYLETINSSGRALLEIINDILDLSKVDAGKMDLVLVPVSLRAICSDMESLLYQKMVKKGLRFVIKIDSALPEALLLDGVRVRQVLLNLLGNAIKYTDNGVIQLSIDCVASEQRVSCFDLYITVADTGVGIPFDKQKAIFGAFEQVVDSSGRAAGGTGLGLAITKQFVELMNGILTVKSQPGLGSQFQVFLPEVAVAALDMEIEDESQQEEIVFKKACVVVIDDIAENIMLLEGFFAKYDFDVYSAGDGKSGYDLIKQHHPDLVLTDIKMPTFDGCQLVTLLKQESDLKNIPVIAVTASALKSEEHRIRCMVDGYLKKPISRSDLIHVLKEFLPYEVCSSSIEKVDEASLVEEHDNNSITLQLWQILNGDLMTRWESVNSEPLTVDIKQFKDRVQQMCEEQNLSSLIDWCDRLQIYIEADEYERMKDVFSEFPSVVGMLHER